MSLAFSKCVTSSFLVSSMMIVGIATVLLTNGLEMERQRESEVKGMSRLKNGLGLIVADDCPDIGQRDTHSAFGHPMASSDLQATVYMAPRIRSL